MPTLTARACSYPGCARTDRHSHRRVDERPSSSARGYDRHHRRWRLMVLARGPVCANCQREIATEADHIVPLNEGGDWSLENGQGLCKPCHTKKTFKENAGNQQLGAG